MKFAVFANSPEESWKVHKVVSLKPGKLFVKYLRLNY